MSTLGDTLGHRRQRVISGVLQLLSTGDDTAVPERLVAELFDGLLARIEKARAPTPARILDAYADAYSPRLLFTLLLQIAAGMRRILMSDAPSKRMLSIASGAIDRAVIETLREMEHGPTESSKAALYRASPRQPVRVPTIIRNIQEILASPTKEQTFGTVMILAWIENDIAEPDAAVEGILQQHATRLDGGLIVGQRGAWTLFLPQNVNQSDVSEMLELALSLHGCSELSCYAIALSRGQAWVIADAEHPEPAGVQGLAWRRALAMAMASPPSTITVDESVAKSLSSSYTFLPCEHDAPPGSYCLDIEQPKRLERWEHASLIDEPELCNQAEALSQLTDIFATAKPGAHLVQLRGRAGIGKRRIITEALRSTALPRGRTLWAQPHPFASAPYWPLAVILRQLLELKDLPIEPQLLERRLRGLNQGQLDSTELATFVRVLAILFGGVGHHLSANDEPEPVNVRAWIAKAACFLFQAAANRLPQLPLVLVFPEAQSLDGPTLDVLQHVLLEYRAEAPLVVTLLHRGVKNASMVSPSPAHKLKVRSLDEDAIAGLARSALDQADVPQDLLELLRTKAAGSPMGALSILRSLAESGALRRQDGAWHYSPRHSENIPQRRLGALFEQRIRRLPGHLSDLLKLAATLGSELDSELLTCIAERKRYEGREVAKNLWLLTELGYLHHADSAEAYRFSHPVVHEVALRIRSTQERQQFHSWVCEAYLSLRPTSLQQMPAVLFYHAAEAQLWGIAKQAARHAVKQAVLLHDYPLVLKIVERTLPHARQEETEDLLLRYELLSAREQAHEARQRRDEQQKDLDGLIKVAQAIGDPVLLGTAHHRYARLHLLCGNPDRAKSLATRALDYLTAHSALDEANALRTLALIYWQQKEAGKAAEALHQALQHYENLGHRRGVGFVLHSLGMFSLDTGALEKARGYFAKALQMKRATDDRAGEAVMLDALGELALLEGNATQAAEHLRRSLQIKQHIQYPLASTEVALSKALLALGDPHGAEQLAKQAQKVSRGKRRSDRQRLSTEARLVLAQALLAQGDKRRAARCAAMALQTTKTMEASLLHVRALLTQAQIDLTSTSQRRLTRAQQHAAHAAKLAMQANAYRWCVEALSLQAESLWRLQNPLAKRVAKQTLSMLARRAPIGVAIPQIQARCRHILEGHPSASQS